MHNLRSHAPFSIWILKRSPTRFRLCRTISPGQSSDITWRNINLKTFFFSVSTSRRHGKVNTVLYELISTRVHISNTRLYYVLSLTSILLLFIKRIEIKHLDRINICFDPQRDFVFSANKSPFLSRALCAYERLISQTRNGKWRILPTTQPFYIVYIHSKCCSKCTFDFVDHIDSCGRNRWWRPIFVYIKLSAETHFMCEYRFQRLSPYNWTGSDSTEYTIS